MKSNRKTIQIVILGVVALIGLFTVVSNLSAGPAKFPAVGEKAPGFTLQGLDGQTHKLADLKGKTVILNFWGTYCPPCKEEMPALQHEYDKWKAKGVEYVGVNIGENAVTIRAFLDQYQLSLPVWLDQDQAIRKAYGVSEYPTTFFIGPDGKILKKQVGGMDEAYIEQTLTEIVKK